MDTDNDNDGIVLRVDKTVRTEDIIAGTPIETILRAKAKHEFAFADTIMLTPDQLGTLEETLKRIAEEERSKAAKLTPEDGIWFSLGNDPKHIAKLEYADPEFNRGIDVDEEGKILGSIDIMLRRIATARKNMGASAVHQSGRFAVKAGELGALVTVYSAELADESLTRLGRYIRDTSNGKTKLGKDLIETYKALVNFRDRKLMPYFYRKDHEREIFVPAEEFARLSGELYSWARNSALPWIKNKAGPKVGSMLSGAYRTFRRDIARPIKRKLLTPLLERIKESSKKRIERYYAPDQRTGRLVLRDEIEIGYAHAARKAVPWLIGGIAAFSLGLIVYASDKDFEEVKARDPSAAVFRYNPSADNRRFGANPYEVADKFNEQYAECVQKRRVSVYDLRYGNGQKVFRRSARIPKNYRMKDKSKNLYVKLDSGPCVAER